MAGYVDRPVPGREKKVGERSGLKRHRRKKRRDQRSTIAFPQVWEGGEIIWKKKKHKSERE